MDKITVERYADGWAVMRGETVLAECDCRGNAEQEAEFLRDNGDAEANE